MPAFTISPVPCSSFEQKIAILYPSAASFFPTSIKPSFIHILLSRLAPMPRPTVSHTSSSSMYLVYSSFSLRTVFFISTGMGSSFKGFSVSRSRSMMDFGPSMMPSGTDVKKSFPLWLWTSLNFAPDNSASSALLNVACRFTHRSKLCFLSFITSRIKSKGSFLS